MELLESISNMNTNYFAYILIALFFTLEQILSGQFKFIRRPHHLFQNIPFEILVFLGNLFWAAVTVMLVEWFNTKQIGIFHHVDFPYWIQILAGIAMIDLVTYWFHRLAHNITVLWRFHRVHHSDISMDSSTYFRGHPIETLFWFGTSPVVAAGIFGLDLRIVGIYYVAVTPFLVIEHVNLKFPVWLDKTIGWIITTPNLHKVHHEQDEQYTNSNYADIFILWDRLFGTYKHKPVEEIKLGLKEFDHPEKQSFWYLLKSPFINIYK